MFVFLGRRILLTLPALFGVALVVFALMRAIPGDVVTQLVGAEQEVTAEQLAELRRIFGLDLPIHVQFGQWLSAALQGDLGSSCGPAARSPPTWRCASPPRSSSRS